MAFVRNACFNVTRQAPRQSSYGGRQNFSFLSVRPRYGLAPFQADGVLAQLVERLNGIEEVRGSNPLGSIPCSFEDVVRLLPELVTTGRRGDSAWKPQARRVFYPAPDTLIPSPHLRLTALRVEINRGHAGPGGR